MSRYVVDASVAVKWYVDEIHSDAARTLLASRDELSAPAFHLVEVANTFAKKVRTAELQAHIAVQALEHIARRVILVQHDLTRPALELALRYQRSVYDALYVVLALQLGCPLITADEKLFNALKPEFGAAFVWLGDVTG